MINIHYKASLVEFQLNSFVYLDPEFIGMTKEMLLKFMGSRFHYLKGRTIYADFGEYEGIFWLKNKIIHNFEIKKTCR